MKRRSTDEPRNEALSEQDERLLNALFDGEMNRDEFSRRANSGAQALKGQAFTGQIEQELDALRELRREIRSWHADRIQDGEGKPIKIDIWEQIKGQVEEQAKGASRSGAFDLRGAIARLLEGGWFPRPAYIGGSFAAATLLGFALYSGARMSPHMRQSETIGQVAMKTAEPEVVTVARNDAPGASQFSASSASVLSGFGSEADSDRDQLIGVLGDEPPADVLAMMNESDADSRRRYVPPLPDSLKVRLLSPQMVAGTTNVGLRTSSGADIDWIKTNKPFKIVAAQDYSAPPVIWVASKKGR